MNERGQRANLNPFMTVYVPDFDKHETRTHTGTWHWHLCVTSTTTTLLVLVLTLSDTFKEGREISTKRGKNKGAGPSRQPPTHRQQEQAAGSSVSHDTYEHVGKRGGGRLYGDPGMCGTGRTSSPQLDLGQGPMSTVGYVVSEPDTVSETGIQAHKRQEPRDQVDHQRLDAHAGGL